jgi:hypothetical protein
MNTLSTVAIRPIAKHNAQTLIILGICGLMLSVVIFHFVENFHAPIVLVTFLASLVTFFFGYLKYLEPDTSLLLTPEYLQYQHKYGSWQIKWSSVVQITPLVSNTIFERKTLPFVAIKLKHSTELLTTISPRLASRLIHEQRPLLIHAINQQLLTVEQSIINFKPYRDNSVNLTGPRASFAHHTQVLKQALGYDLYIPASALDRPVEDFCKALNAYRLAAIRASID